jgi:hypothetical protein
MNGGGGSGFFCRFPSWGGRDNNAPQGTDRDGGNPDCQAQTQGHEGPCARFSFDDKKTMTSPMTVEAFKGTHTHTAPR